ncbi:wolframin [Cloeon dipterum]|uniref:wolframin n=1 Tax=Cloeon dipterum TaxID=197152 RepID=UPI00321F6B14
MAGVVPVPLKKASRRKQWTYHDGPRSSLRLLQGQLAEDGCPEAQVALAKQLLNDTENVEDKEENDRLAVYWLIKASEQGHLDATEILQHCLDIGRGISEQNFLDVQKCLKMSQDEKLARRAARQLFNSLSAGQDYITTDQLRRRIVVMKKRRLTSSHQLLKGPMHSAADNNSESDGSDPHTDWTSRAGQSYSGEKLTEDCLVSAATTYTRGELPLVQRVLVLADPERGQLEQIGFIQRSVLHPWATVVLVYVSLLEFFARRGSSLLQMIIPTSPVHTILLLLCYWLAGAESLSWLFSIMIFYTSFGFMFIATMEMLQREKEFQHFRVWSQLFLSHSSNPADLGGGYLDSSQAERRFLNGGVGQYVRFFAALLFFIVSYPLVNSSWVPHAEISVIATVLSVITLFSFMDSWKKPDGLMLLSFALNVLARYPYEFDAVVQGWQFLDLRAPAFASSIVGRSVEFCLTYRSLLHLSVALILVRMAVRNGWAGVCRGLIPHCVALAWWQIAVLSAESATKFGLLRAAFSIVGLGFCVPLIGVLLLLLPALAILKTLTSTTLLVKAASSSFVAALPFALSWWIAKLHRRGTVHAGRLVLALQLICSVVAMVMLIYPVSNSTLSSISYLQEEQHASATKESTHNIPEPESGLTWDMYHQHCHQPAWEQSSVAVTQLSCSPLSGTSVSWNGYVTSVEVSKMSNPLASGLQLFPSLISSTLACLIGEQVPLVCPEGRSTEAGQCRLHHLTGRKCHLDSWANVEVTLSVKMKSKRMWGTDAQVRLVAEDFFKNFTAVLQPQDRIWFKGELLADGLGGPAPKISLQQIDCLDCHKSDLLMMRKPGLLIASVTTLIDVGQLALQSFIGFVLGPMIRFT